MTQSGSRPPFRCHDSFGRELHEAQDGDTSSPALIMYLFHCHSQRRSITSGARTPVVGSTLVVQAEVGDDGDDTRCGKRADDASGEGSDHCGDQKDL